MNNNEEHVCCGGTGDNCCGGTHDDGCCSGSHEHKHEYITLTLDNNETLKCAVIGIFDAIDNEYIALLPEGDDEVLIYQYEEGKDGGAILTNIKTEDEFKEVEKVFFELVEEDSNTDVDSE